MTKLVTSWKSLPVAFILVATAAAPALSQQGSPRDDVQHQETYKLAQGQLGLNGGNVSGEGQYPWSGPTNDQNNPISGSPQDPAMPLQHQRKRFRRH
jgi:hypothetical protein